MPDFWTRQFVGHLNNFMDGEIHGEIQQLATFHLTESVARALPMTRQDALLTLCSSEFVLLVSLGADSHAPFLLGVHHLVGRYLVSWNRIYISHRDLLAYQYGSLLVVFTSVEVNSGLEAFQL
jgi:hypothetical protein